MASSRQGRAILLRDRYPDLFDAYVENFVEGFEHRHYAVRTGHVRPTAPEGKEVHLGTWRRVKARGKDIPFPHDLGSRDRLVEKHLGFENWNRHVAATGRGKRLGEPFFLGLCASKTTRHVVFDIDCHGGRRIHYRRQGRRLPVADLGLSTLQDLRKLYDLGRPPDVLMTSSPSLGLYAYFQFRHPAGTEEVLPTYRTLARSVGLECEIYPSLTNCLRRPLGDGSFVLSPRGVLREFADQMRYYLDPEPVPPFEEVVEMLLDLWAEQHEEMAAHHDGDLTRDWRDPEIDPAIERDHMDRRVREIRSWIASGGTHPDMSGPQVVVAREGPPPAPSSGAGGSGQAWPEAWKEPNVHWRDRVWHLARFGLPLPDTLNCALLDLAQWLVGVEFYHHDDRDERARRLLEVFCATRHNDQSDRLRGVEEVADIPPEVLKEITAALANAHDVVEKGTFVTIRGRTYKTPLVVEPLLNGVGEPCRYRPAGNPCKQEHNTPASPLSVAVSPATSPDVDHGGVDLLAILESGNLDRPLPPSIEARITRRGKALSFLRRLGNYLYHRGGVARIHHAKLSALADVEVSDRKALSRYKRVGIGANLFRETDGYVVGERSIEYSLTEEAVGLFAEVDGELPPIGGEDGGETPVRDPVRWQEAG